MKTKKLIMGSLLVVAISCFTLISCQKETTTTTTTSTTVDDTQDQTTSASDEAQVEGQSDEAIDDANNIIDGVGSMSAKTDVGSNFPCGATVDTANTGTTGIITVVYNGDNCDLTRTRTGTMTITIPSKRWKVKGSTLTITFTNFKVTRKSDGKYITFNGSRTITNVEGGGIKDLFKPINPQSSIVQKERGSFNITFDDSTTRTWSVARTRTYSAITSTLANKPYAFAVTLAGDTTKSTIAQVAVWGTNRKGTEFHTVLSESIVSNTNCGLRKPVSGVRVHKGLARELTVTFGVDTSGVKVSTGCPEYYKLNWTNAKGVAKEVVLKYK